MNDTAQIILAVATLVTSIGTIILGLANRGSIKQVQKQTDGLLSELKEAADAKGNLQGRKDERAEFPTGHHSGPPVQQ